MKIVIAIVTAATLWPVILSAADVEREMKWKGDIAGCVQKVRQMHIGLGSFDAFATPDGRVTYFGTAQERFQFMKCMNERGWILDE